LHQPVDEGDLGEADADDERPNKPLAQAQAALPVVAEPETEPGRTGGNDVAIPQPNGLNGRLVDGNDGAGVCRQGEAFRWIQSEFEVIIPNPVVLQF